MLWLNHRNIKQRQILPLVLVILPAHSLQCTIVCFIQRTVPGKVKWTMYHCKRSRVTVGEGLLDTIQNNGFVVEKKVNWIKFNAVRKGWVGVTNRTISVVGPFWVRCRGHMVLEIMSWLNHRKRLNGIWLKLPEHSLGIKWIFLLYSKTSKY